MPLLVFACVLVAGKVQAAGFHVPIKELRRLMDRQALSRMGIPPHAMTAMQFAILDCYDFIRVRRSSALSCSEP